MFRQLFKIKSPLISVVSCVNNPGCFFFDQLSAEGASAKPFVEIFGSLHSRELFPCLAWLRQVNSELFYKKKAEKMAEKKIQWSSLWKKRSKKVKLWGWNSKFRSLGDAAKYHEEMGLLLLPYRYVLKKHFENHIRNVAFFLVKASNRIWTFLFGHHIFKCHFIGVLRDEKVKVGCALHSAWRLQKYQVGKLLLWWFRNPGRTHQLIR